VAAAILELAEATYAAIEAYLEYVALAAAVA